MGFFDRFKRSHEFDQPSEGQVSAQLMGGNVDLEVVGESFYQDALWTACGGDKTNRIRQPVIAVLDPQHDNPYDANAVAVLIEGQVVGHLSRDVCAQYRPGLEALMKRLSSPVALRGVIVGGGASAQRAGTLGVWLEHDPSDFGVASSPSRTPVPQAPTVSTAGAMRTGFSEAWLTDVEDDSYDLSWFDSLDEEDGSAITQLRQLLATDPDPIDRHFQFAELESRLYRMRGDESSLAEYDEVCRRHDAEMEGICQAFMTKWGKIPLLETYKQMAIRQQKNSDWAGCAWWAERGLALYGESAARPDAVADLAKRRDRARLKLEAAESGSSQPKGESSAVVVQAPSPSSASAYAGSSPPAVTEELTCTRCGRVFERIKVRGRKPLLCPECRSAPDLA